MAVNSVTTSNSQGYFKTVVNSLLSPFDRVSADGTVCKCNSTAQHGHHNVRINRGTTRISASKFDFDHIVPDSGAISHMHRNCMEFEDDYVTCNDFFVLMGDNFEIPVLGYGTSCLKIKSHAVRLVNSLHIPCSMFQIYMLMYFLAQDIDQMEKEILSF